MKNWLGIIIMSTALLFLLFNVNPDNLKNDKDNTELKEPTIEYGIITDSFVVKKGTIENGQVLGEILYFNHIDHPQISAIVEKSRGIFDVRKANPEELKNRKDS